ncbi:MAG TPA: hypothetical protein VNO30_27865 [Kofleriaceae bacterium]|nr:hypothetical protein [Kofleriaceae bacterium]
MLDRLRRPFFVAALIAWLLVVLVELGAGLLPVPDVSATELRAAILRDRPPDEPPPSDAELQGMVRARREEPPRPGYAITALVAFDGLVFLGLFWMGAALVISRRLVGRVQGIISLIVALVTIVISIVAVIVLITLLLVMVGLLLAPPFGTLAYLAIWGFFARGAAAATLGILLMLKLAAAVLLVLAQQAFLKNVRLLILLGLSLVLTVIVSFLHGFPPGILVSITDVVAALIILVVAILWAIVLLIGSIVATIKAIPPEKTRA